MSIKILLCDDHAVVRDGLRALLEAQADFKVVGTAGAGREALSAARELRPDVIVMDIAMPEINGIDTIPQLREALPDVQVLILSMHGSSEYIYRALKAGARGYLLKESAGHLLAIAVRTVHAGRRYLDDKIKETVVFEYLEKGHAKSPLENLSVRERSILQLIVDGHSNPETARLLNLSVKTVETYRSRLMQKLGLGDLPALVKFAIEHGLTQVI